MCSIFGVLDIKTDPTQLRSQAIEMSKLLRHRGPDWSGVYSSDKAILVHERLAIVGVSSGAQPLYNPEKTHYLAVNGEIYNHKQLAKELITEYGVNALCVLTVSDHIRTGEQTTAQERETSFNEMISLTLESLLKS